MNVRRGRALAACCALWGCGGRAQLDPGGTHDQDAGDAGPSRPLLCKPFKACGGNLVGSWAIESDCEDAETQQLGCQTLKYSATQDTGTQIFLENGSFELRYSSTVRYAVDMPASCAGPTETCDSIQAEAGEALTDAGTGTATCVDEGDLCHCDVLASRTGARLSGTYTTVNGILTLLLDPKTQTTISLDYCVVGKTLLTHDRGGDGGETLVRQ